MKVATAEKPEQGLLVRIGAAVRAQRRARGWTLKELASQAGLSERFLADLEVGRANISVLNLAEVASALERPLASFLDAPSEPARGVVSLLGLRGAGKSSVGRALADRLGVPFFELDRLVEEAAGMSLGELFSLHGEAYFRSLELRTLRAFLDEHRRAVLATGGGIVTSPEAFSLVLERTRAVWLKASPKEHWERVVRQGDLRPMQDRPQAMAELRRRLEERAPLYAQAELAVTTSGKAVPALARELARRLA